MTRSFNSRRSLGLLTVLVLMATPWSPVPASTGAIDPPTSALPVVPGALPDLSSAGHRLAGLRAAAPAWRTIATTKEVTEVKVASGARPRCFGKRATIVGTRKANKLRGTRGRDIIVGLGGADRIFGLGGNDLICGTGGSDYVVPGGGNDKVNGGGGGDTLAASKGRDRLKGGPGLDWLDFRASRRGVVAVLAKGRSTGERWTSMENLIGSRHRDTLSGSSRRNQLRGGAGNDVLAGLEGDDVLIGQGGDDTLDGGAGTLDFAAHPTAPGPVTADMAAGTVTGDGTDRLLGVEGVAGSRHADSLNGGAATSVLSGGPGDDRIVGSGASDFLLPLVAGARVNLLAQQATSEGLDSVTGIEVVVGTAGNDVLTGSDSNDVILAGAGVDTVHGGSGSDILSGGDGPDAVNGGAGDDVLRGDHTSPAADRLDGGDGADVADYGTSTSGVSVNLTTGTGPDGDTLAATEMVAGSAQSDVIVGDAGNNTLTGGAGDDSIAGAGGNDVISGGPGVDRLSGDTGADYLTGDDDGGSADGGDDSDLCLGLAPATACEATEFSGGTQPGAGRLAHTSPRSGSGERSASQVPAQGRVPSGGWIGHGNPLVACNDGYASTSAVVTAHLPAQVRPDYASSNQQTIWLRQELFDLFQPNAPVQNSRWYYNVLNSDQWTTNSWYLYEGDGSDPLDAWRTNFPRNYQVNYAVVYDMWWQDNVTGQYLYHSRFRAWHTNDNVWFSDRCAARAMGYFNGSPNTSTPTCSYNWSDSFCATYRAFFSSFSTPFLYPNTTFRAGDSA